MQTAEIFADTILDAETPAGDRETRKSGSILLIEDEAVIALDMANDLETWSYSVVGISRTMNQALEIAAMHRPSIAVVDVALGDGQDGIDIAEALRARFGTKIIFLTAQTDKVTRSRIIAMEPMGYLFKPYSAFALRQLLETFESG